MSQEIKREIESLPESETRRFKSRNKLTAVAEIKKGRERVRQ